MLLLLFLMSFHEQWCFSSIPWCCFFTPGEKSEMSIYLVIDLYWVWTLSLGKHHRFLFCLAIVLKIHPVASLNAVSFHMTSLPSLFLAGNPSFLLSISQTWALPATSEYVCHRTDDEKKNKKQKKPTISARRTTEQECGLFRFESAPVLQVAATFHTPLMGQQDHPFLTEERFCTEYKSPFFCI